jgi:hypothetical protein
LVTISIVVLSSACRTSPRRLATPSIAFSVAPTTQTSRTEGRARRSR